MPLPVGRVPGRYHPHRALIATLLASWPGAASAQTAPALQALPATSASQAGADVVVSGRRPAADSTIDRKTYRVGNDLQSSGGSASDVLRNVPAVDVDAQGAVTLRGDASVQVLIDGKPSTTLTAGNRADALEQLPANTIDHVEVITNPSARFKPDGSAGIINIVTKRNRRPGLTGSVNASGGTDGRGNLAGNASWRTGALATTAGATLRRDMRWRPFRDERTEIDPATGAPTSSVQESLFRGEKLSRVFSAGLDLGATTTDRLSANGSYTHRTGTPRITQRNIVAGPGGGPTSDFARDGIGHENEVTDEAKASWRHKTGSDGQITLDLRRGETIENEVRRFTNSYRAPPGLVTIDQQRPRLDTLQRELTAEYERPLAGGKLLAGYDVQRDDDDFRNRGDLIDPMTGIATVDRTRTNRFRYQQTVHAWYATWNRKLAARLGAIAGLRLEQTIIGTDQADLHLTGRQHYFRAYPTLHLQYDLEGGQVLKASTTSRVIRPDPEDLDPNVVFSDPLNQRAGNPALRPAETRAFEVAWQRDTGAGSLEATLFLRHTRNAFTTVSRFITPSTLLTTQENLGRSSSFGLDASGNGKLARTVAWRLSGIVSRNAIDAGNLGFAGTRSLVSLTAKGGLDWTPSKPDLLQITANYNGRRLTPQGYRLASASTNIGYRHRFANGLSAVVSVADLFDSQRERVRIDTPDLVERTVRRNGRRTATLSLALPLGGARRDGADPTFDFGE